jgi:hypothetical protein
MLLLVQTPPPSPKRTSLSASTGWLGVLVLVPPSVMYGLVVGTMRVYVLTCGIAWHVHVRPHVRRCMVSIDMCVSVPARAPH